MPEAICIRCGGFKSDPWERCRFCGLDPKRDVDTLAKSVYLSIRRFEDEEMNQKYRKRLQIISDIIRDGKDIYYDDTELRRLVMQRRIISNVPWYAPWLVIFKMLLRLSLWVFFVSIIIFSIAKLFRL